ACMRTLRAEQIKKTKTILRVYMCDNEGVYRRLSTAKNTCKQLSRRIFCGTGLYKRQEKKILGEKDDLSPAIGENYINKMFLFFFLTFYLWMFLLIA
ncbi:hypothetical protein J7L48_03525, partial [bacterium]|nr:hypothetical protein [bacterium]